MVQEVLSDTIDDKMKEFVFFMEEKGDCKISNLLFRVFCCRDQIDGFKVAEIYVPTQYVYVQKLLS